MRDVFDAAYSMPCELCWASQCSAQPIALRDLPPIDAVVISHDYFDHLDRTTIEGMRDCRTVPHPGVELVAIDGHQRTGITATPARHATGRHSSASNLILASFS